MYVHVFVCVYGHVCVCPACCLSYTEEGKLSPAKNMKLAAHRDITSRPRVAELAHL